MQDLNEGEKQETSIDGDDSALVTLSLSMPPVTRAMTDAQENHVDNVDVLLFSTTDDKLYYRAIGASITNPAGNSREFNARLPLGTYNVVVLANARDLFTGAIAPSSLFGGPPPAAATGDTRSSVLGGLTFSSITSGKIPMWGYYNGLTIDDLTPSPAATVDLTRAIARVDVSLDAAVNNFELTSVHLYHYSDKGNIAPVASGIGTYLSSQWDATNKKATGPNLAASAKVNNFVSYTVPASQSSAFKQEIYTFEATQGDPVTPVNTDWKDNTCLVIGGKYDNGSETFYRVEFREGADPGPYTYLALLRNHLYDVVIKEVKGHGYPGRVEAYNSLSSNIVVRITEWNDGGMNDVEFNGQHYLAVDKSHVDLYKEGYAKEIRVSTDYPSGWTIEKPTGNEWITVSPLSYTGSQGNDQQTINVSAAAVTSARSGEFYIVAGNLRKKITVAQSADEEFSIEIDPWELVFYKTPAAAQTVTLSPVPTADGANYFLGFTAAGNIAWTTPADFSALSPTTPSIDLQPATNGGASTLNSTVLVTFTGPLGQTITRTISIKQLAREIFEAVMASTPYPAIGGSDLTFTVTSDVPWQLSESSDFLALSDETEQGPVASYAYTFSLTPSPSYRTGRAITVTVTSSAPNFPATTFDIQQAGHVPYLDITEPTPVSGAYVIDFGTSTATREVVLETNAPWKHTRGTGYTNVVSLTRTSGTTTNIANNATQSAGYTPDQPLLTPAITLTPATVTGKAGDRYESTLTFATVSGSAPEASKTITIKRQVPVSWDFTSYTLNGGSRVLEANIPNPVNFTGAATIRLYANTNIDWWIRVDNGTPATQNVSAATTDSYLEASVPTRAWDVAANWRKSSQSSTTNRKTITITTGYTGSTANDIVTINFAQLAYTINRPSGTAQSLGTITSGSQNLSVAIESTATQFNLEVVYSDGTATESITRTPGSAVSIPVKSNTASSTRTITIRHKETADVLYTATQQKSGYLLVALSRQSWDGSSSFYPYYPTISSCPLGYALLIAPSEAEAVANYVDAVNSSAWRTGNAVTLFVRGQTYIGSGMYSNTYLVINHTYSDAIKMIPVTGADHRILVVGSNGTRLEANIRLSEYDSIVLDGFDIPYMVCKSN